MPGGARLAGQAEEGDAQLAVGKPDHGAEIGLAAVPLGDQLEPEQIAVERDGAVEIADAETGVVDPRDGHSR